MNREQLRIGLRSFTRSDARLDQMMDMIDRYVVGLLKGEAEVMTAEEVADYLGLTSPDHARTTLSRKGIRSCGYRGIPGQRGRGASVYPADLVRALKEKQ